MDFMTVLINSMISKDIYLKHPKDFLDLQHTDWVWQVKALVYVLKQAPRKWNQNFTKELLSPEWNSQSMIPYCSHKQEGKVLGAIGVHIDDLMNSWFVDGLDGKLCNRF